MDWFLARGSSKAPPPAAWSQKDKDASLRVEKSVIVLRNLTVMFKNELNGLSCFKQSIRYLHSWACGVFPQKNKIWIDF
jgi:hypothetical protein